MQNKLMQIKCPTVVEKKMPQVRQLYLWSDWSPIAYALFSKCGCLIGLVTHLPNKVPLTFSFHFTIHKQTKKLFCPSGRWSKLYLTLPERCLLNFTGRWLRGQINVSEFFPRRNDPQLIGPDVLKRRLTSTNLISTALTVCAFSEGRGN